MFEDDDEPIEKLFFFSGVKVLEEVPLAFPIIVVLRRAAALGTCLNRTLFEVELFIVGVTAELADDKVDVDDEESGWRVMEDSSLTLELVAAAINRDDVEV